MSTADPTPDPAGPRRTDPDLAGPRRPDRDADSPGPADPGPVGPGPAGPGPDGPNPADAGPGAVPGTAGGASGGGEAQDRAAYRRERAVSGILAAALILEGITVLFVPQAIAGISDDGLGGGQLAVLLVLAAALFVAAGIQKRPAGPLIGSLLQVAVILTGLMVAAMYFLGLVFAAVWGFLLWVRQEIARAAARQAGPPPV